MIRMAVFDIDRTLIPPETGEIAPETEAALRTLWEKGILLAIASGRLFSFLQPRLRELAFDYYILSNGACITDAAGNILARSTLLPQLVEDLTAEMIRRDYPMDVRYFGGKRSANPNCSVNRRMKPFWEKQKFAAKLPREMLREYTPEPGEEAISCSGYIPEEQLPEFSRLFPRLAFLPVFESPLCDINDASVSKASGVAQVCALAGISMEQVIAFGDDRNDLEMIREAGIGVAMGNGIREVREAADYIAPASQDLGVVEALDHFGLLGP